MNRFLKLIKDNIKCYIAGDFDYKDDVELNDLWNPALARVDRTWAGLTDDVGPLTPSQKKALRDFYAPYEKNISDLFHRIYTHRSGGAFYPEYIPEELMYTKIDRFYNNRDEATYLANKVYAYRLFSNVKQPDLICARSGGVWITPDIPDAKTEQKQQATPYSPGYRIISPREVLRLIEAESEIVLKQAEHSEGGSGVIFINAGTAGKSVSVRDSIPASAAESKSPSDTSSSSSSNIVAGFKKAIKDIHFDVIIQRPVKQHASLAALNESSLNTIRVVSFLDKPDRYDKYDRYNTFGSLDKFGNSNVKIYSACVKVGSKGERLDNGVAGGAYVGLYPDGRLKEKGVFYGGRVSDIHPDHGYRYADKKIEHFDRALALVKSAHPFMGHFRIIYWDVAIDEEGDAVLIEANLALGGISEMQICNGPLFGDDTVKILDEVYGRRPSHVNYKQRR